MKILWLLAVVACVGCEGQRVEPRTYIGVEITAAQREELSPAVRQLLEEIESRQAAGKPAAMYSEALQQATKIDQRGPYKAYFFNVIPETEPEGRPVIMVYVDRSGRIMHCGTDVPVW
jgi:hypothetical protein